MPETHAVVRSEALPTGDDPQSLSAVLARVVGGRGEASLRRGGDAAAAWARANGDMERDHTVRVWLRRAPRPSLDPTLVVELDSHSIIADFTAKRELYLGRLANDGLRISRIEFRLGRRRDGSPAATSDERCAQRPPSDEEMARIESLVACVGERLRPSVRGALLASFTRERREPPRA